MIAGAVVLLLFVVGVPIVLVPTAMDDVPDRSKTKVMANYQEAANIVERTYAKHRDSDRPGRLTPLPENSRAWIELINPMGRKAPGGGLSILTEPDAKTGAIGLVGDQNQVVITIPAYQDLEARSVTIKAEP